MGSAGSLRHYGSHNIEKLLEQVTRNSIGMDEYLSNVFSGFQEIIHHTIYFRLVIQSQGWN